MRNVAIFSPKTFLNDRWVALSEKDERKKIIYVKDVTNFGKFPIHAVYFPTSQWHKYYQQNLYEIDPLLEKLVENWKGKGQSKLINHIRKYLKSPQDAHAREGFYQSLGMYLGI